MVRDRIMTVRPGGEVAIQHRYAGFEIGEPTMLRNVRMMAVVHSIRRLRMRAIYEEGDGLDYVNLVYFHADDLGKVAPLHRLVHPEIR